LAHFVRTRRAEEDLIEIWTFIAADDAYAADRLLDRIDAACALLAENPALGLARPDLRPDFRYYPLGRYLILYRIAGASVEIVRVVHGARDLPRLLGEG
jgi:toxin ParE1/3/4